MRLLLLFALTIWLGATLPACCMHARFCFGLVVAVVGPLLMIMGGITHVLRFGRTEGW
jgi:hypothetical protein